MPTDGENGGGVIIGYTCCGKAYSVEGFTVHLRVSHQNRRANADFKPIHTTSFKKKGMGSRKSRSSCSVVRRSQRLLGMPALDVPLPSTKPRKPSQFFMVSKPIRHTKPLKEPRLTTAQIARLTLKIASRSLLLCYDRKDAYPYGDVERTCIYSPDNFHTHSAKCSPAGFTWVAVHGVGTTWAVFKKDEDAARRMYQNPGCWETFYYEIGSIAISEVEALADKNPTATPFAVVCVNSGTANALEVSSKQAVDFVRSKTHSGFPSTDADNIQIAIGAFQLIWQVKFKASDIWVSVFHPLKRTSLLTWEVEDHLARINTPDSGFYTKEDWAWMNRPLVEEEH